MLDSNDGFEIAEVDLKLRGPGDILGTRQSGLINLKLANLVKDYQILYLARKEASKILKEDADLSNPSNIKIRDFYLKYYAKLLKWTSVS